MTSALNDDVVETLTTSTLLGVLPRDELAALVARARHHHLADGELVFRRDDDGDAVFVVLEGRVKISALSVDGAEVILNVIEPGEVFGEMSLLDGEPRCADAIAAAPTAVVVIERSDFVDVLARHPDASRELMALLCRRIRQTSTFAESAVLLSAAARLFLRMRGLAEQYGVRKPSGAIVIKHGFSQQELADSVGLTRVSVNKHLTEWRRSGLIDYHRKTITIGDLEALATAAFEGRAPARVTRAG